MESFGEVRGGREDACAEDGVGSGSAEDVGFDGAGCGRTVVDFINLEVGGGGLAWQGRIKRDAGALGTCYEHAQCGNVGGSTVVEHCVWGVCSAQKMG